MHTQRFPVALLFAAFLPWLPSCGADVAQFSPEQRFTARERPVQWNASDQDRLQLRGMAPAMGGGMGAPQGGATYTAPTPQGWKALPAEPSMFKDLNFEVAGNEDASCYLTGSVGGGLEGNIDRWYGQMGAQSPGNFAALPQAELMGRNGTLVEIEGPFRGKPDFKLLGLITAEGQQCTTLKLVGPKAVVDAEKERFLQLAKSIRSGAGAATPAAPATGAPTGGGLQATTPPGWKELPPEPSMFKDLYYEVAGNPDATCYLTAAVGGGLEGNLMRWYGQLGDEPPTTGTAGLPSQQLLGKSGLLVEISGSYKGSADYKLLGIVSGEGQLCSTLKLIGPRAVVDAEKAHFLQLAQSIRMGGAAVNPSQTPTAPTPGEGKGPIASYKVPDGWKEVPSSSSMRLFTFQVGEQTELSVIVLGGNGGGMRPNLDRWRGQMGEQPLSDAEYQALTQIEVFGAKVPLLEMRGKFSDGMTGRAFDDAAFFGVSAEQPDGAFFFKFTGPYAEAQAHRQEFLDFCASLRR